MRLPFVPTLMVAVMVPVMIGLGIWQLQRAEWKETLLAELAAAPSKPVADLDAGSDADSFNFRRVVVTCRTLAANAVAVAGRNVHGKSGYSFRLPCRAGVTVVAGWAPRPDIVLAGTRPGRVTGIAIEPHADGNILLYADNALPPLEASAPPSIDTIPNNHIAYAVQWFLFAAMLTVIYAIYVRRRPRSNL